MLLRVHHSFIIFCCLNKFLLLTYDIGKSIYTFVFDFIWLINSCFLFQLCYNSIWFQFICFSYNFLFTFFVIRPYFWQSSRLRFIYYIILPWLSYILQSILPIQPLIFWSWLYLLFSFSHWTNFILTFLNLNLILFLKKLFLNHYTFLNSIQINHKSIVIGVIIIKLLYRRWSPMTASLPVGPIRVVKDWWYRRISVLWILSMVISVYSRCLISYLNSLDVYDTIVRWQRLSPRWTFTIFVFQKIKKAPRENIEIIFIKFFYDGVFPAAGANN